MATHFQYFIPLGAERRDERLAFAAERGLGVEVSAFVGGDALNTPSARTRLEEDLETELAAFPGPKTFHGAFLDLALHSPDTELAALSRRRMERDLVTARHLGCEKIIFHLGFNPLVAVQRYREEVVHAHAAFWPEMLARHPGITICLENLWEADWSIFAEVLDRVPHADFGMCLDVAHAHVHGHYGPEAWIRGLARHIRHLHWSDNSGDRDSHLTLGRGNIDWPAVLDACADWTSATVTLEVSELPSLDRSLAFLAREGAGSFRRSLPVA